VHVDTGNVRLTCKCRLSDLLVYPHHCFLHQYPGTKLNIRPIPFQFLNNAGDYVLNLTNNQEYVGDTVTSTYLAHTLLYALATLITLLLLQHFISYLL
jgi:hypothetical protein